MGTVGAGAKPPYKRTQAREPLSQADLRILGPITPRPGWLPLILEEDPTQIYNLISVARLPSGSASYHGKRTCISNSHPWPEVCSVYFKAVAAASSFSLSLCGHPSLLPTQPTAFALFGCCR